MVNLKTLKTSVVGGLVIAGLALSACSNDEGKKRSRKSDGEKAAPVNPGGTPPREGVKDPKLTTRDPLIVNPDDETVYEGLVVDAESPIPARGTLNVEFENPHVSGAAYPISDNSNSYVDLSGFEYTSETVVEPDWNYEHCDPQDRNDSTRCSTTWTPIETGGADINPDTKQVELVFTDFANDVVMSTLKVIANNWSGHFQKQEYVQDSKEFAAAIRWLRVRTKPGQSKARLEVTIQDSEYRLHKIAFEGNLAGSRRRAVMRQVSNSQGNQGHRYQAYITCLDKSSRTCKTSVVVIEQINAHNEICKRAIAVSRFMDAEFRLPDELMREVNCGTFQGGPDQTRFLTYLANTVHTKHVAMSKEVPYHCTTKSISKGFTPKLPHLEMVQARAYAVAWGPSFIDIEGIESDYDYTSRKNFDTTFLAPHLNSNGALDLFDGSRDWFRFSGNLDRDSESTPEFYGSKMITVEGSSMPRSAPNKTSLMVDTIESVDLVGNDGRGWLSLNINFNDGESSEIEFKGLPDPYHAPGGIKFFPYQDQMAQTVSTYPVQFHK